MMVKEKSLVVRSFHPDRIGRYLRLDDDRRFDFPPIAHHPQGETRRHVTTKGIGFRFDVQRLRVVTDQPDLFLQCVTVVDRDAPSALQTLLLGIAGLRIQFSGKDGSSVLVQEEAGGTGRAQVVIGDIGLPLCYHTGTWDIQAGLRRPIGEMAQILTNASHFPSWKIQKAAVDFLAEVIGAIGDPFGIAVWFGQERSGDLVFADELLQRLRRGDLIGKPAQGGRKPGPDD